MGGGKPPSRKGETDTVGKACWICIKYRPTGTLTGPQISGIILRPRFVRLASTNDEPVESAAPTPPPPDRAWIRYSQPTNQPAVGSPPPPPPPKGSGVWESGPVQSTSVRNCVCTGTIVLDSRFGVRDFGIRTSVCFWLPWYSTVRACTGNRDIDWVTGLGLDRANHSRHNTGPWCTSREI